jgi:oligogalacturonide transport system substrate-binding protein
VEKGIPLSKTAQDYLDAEGMLTGIQFNASEKMSATDGMFSMQPFLENGSVIDAFIDACNQVIYERASLDDAAKALWDTAKDNV